MSKQFSICTNKFRKFYLTTIYFSHFFLSSKFHKSNLRENISFVSARIYELFNCAKIKSAKINRLKTGVARNLVELR